MKEYKLPSGKASIETTGGLSATMEYTVPAKASERNKALHEALEQCLHLSAQCGQLQLQRDIERESVKQLTAERDALAAKVEAFGDKLSEVVALLDVDGMTAVQWLLDNCQEIESLINMEPEQHLAERDAQKGRDGFIAGMHSQLHQRHCSQRDQIEAANQYAESIRQGGAK